ncbi:MAG: hypothetical protein AAFQ89_10570 [Cyanobacteria bacterium J06626_18]
MSEKKLVSFRLPESLILELKAKASEEGVSVTELVSRFSRQGLNLSMEDRLAALEQKLSVAEASNQSLDTAMSQVAMLPVQTDVKQSVDASEPMQTYPGPQEGQMQQRFEGLERRVREEVANLAGELAKLQTQLRLYGDMRAS